jgi:hypothetical protein
VAGKARVHELAKELGVTSKQLLSIAQDLGLYVRSPSSTIEAADARRLRDVVTGRGHATAARRTWPHRPVGNNPYSQSRRLPPAAVSRPLTSSSRLRPSSAEVRPDDDSFGADLRRAQAKSKRIRAAHTPRTNPFIDILYARTPSLQIVGQPIPDVVREWAQMWIKEWFEPKDVAAWMDAGLRGNEAHRAAQLCREGWTPDDWARHGGQST